MHRLDRDGYALADLVFTDTFCDEVIAAIPDVPARSGGLRNLIGHPAVARLLTDARFRRMLWSFSGGDLVAVKATLFDKTPDANWLVTWHQDRLLAVKTKLEAPGYGPWRVKDGVLHVDAPASVLDQVLAVRIHLDDSGPDRGPLRVIPKSHRSGKLNDDELAKLVATSPQVELSVPRGAFLMMRPLLVHASSPSAAGHRRVLHIETAPRNAIKPLEWHTAIAISE